MEKPLNYVRVVGLVALIVAFVWACQKDTTLLKQVDAQQSARAALDNSQMVMEAQDVMSVTANAFANQGLTFGRVADDGDEESDDDGCKPTVTNTIKVDRTKPDSLIISGTLTIDFGTGAACDSSEMRKGKIIDSVYVVITKTKFTANELITFQNYWRDSTQLDGSISIASTNGSRIVKINGTKIRYRDGSSSSWRGNLTFTYQRSGVGSTYTASLDVAGSWSGTTRSGTSFSGTITKDLIFKAGCLGYRHKLTPVSGTLDVTSNGVTSTIDYGDGTCDRTYTITTGGVTTTHRLG